MFTGATVGAELSGWLAPASARRAGERYKVQMPARIAGWYDGAWARQAARTRRATAGAKCGSATVPTARLTCCAAVVTPARSREGKPRPHGPEKPRNAYAYGILVDPTQPPSQGYDWQRASYAPLARPTAPPRTQRMRAGCIRHLSSGRVHH
eukprot:3618846-Prymnesium_polylepis.1